MARFASWFVNNVDKKDRVSVPAPFRAALEGQGMLQGLMSVDHPVVEVCGPEMLAIYQARLDAFDPFSPEYEDWSFYLNGNTISLRLDGEGRIQLNDQVRGQTGIKDKVVFDGRGHSFWLWEPGAYEAYRSQARERIRNLKRNLGSASGTGPATEGRAGT